MRNRRVLLPSLLSIALVLSLVGSVAAAGDSGGGLLSDKCRASYLAADSSSVSSGVALSTPGVNITPMVAAGLHNTVGLKSDGTVVDTFNYVGTWTDIVQVAAGSGHTVGLKSDGTAVAAGWNGDGQCNVGNWTDIVQVAAGSDHTVGLKSDGTVVAVGPEEGEWNESGQCDVGSWTDITQVSAGGFHTVGLKSDGTVVAVGLNDDGQCDVGDWTDIVQVAAGYKHTVGLKSNGAVVAVGRNSSGQCNVERWTDIIQVAAGYYHTVGLKSDGTVVALGYDYYGQCDVGSWMDIIQVAAAYEHTVGLKSSGTVVAVGYSEYDVFDVDDWNLDLECGLTVSSTSGGSVVTPGEGTSVYDEGMVVDLLAEPEQGYRFVRWTGEVSTVGDINAASTKITVRDDYSITANFAMPPIEYHLTIVSTAGGSVTTPGEGIFSYDEGTAVALGAEPEAGCRFLRWDGDVDTMAAVDAASTTISMDGDYAITASFVSPTVAAGYQRTLGIKFDGTVVAVGWNGNGECDVGSWTDMVQVAAGVYHTVGLEADGTVVAVGDNGYGQCDVGSWTDMVQVAAGAYHTVGLGADGTVVAVGYNGSGRCDVSSWGDIVQVAAGAYHTVGLGADGTVVAVGSNGDWQCNVGDWTDIAQVAAGGSHTVGFKDDGTVVTAGDNDYGQRDVGDWTYIVQVAAGGSHTVGLKGSGRVVAVGWNGSGQCDVGSWTDIVQVAADQYHTVGLKSDGTVVAVGHNFYGQCDVGGWDLIAAVNWPLFGGIMAAAAVVGLVIFFARRRRLRIRDFAGKIWGFLCNPATTFWRQLAKDFLWLLLYPAYQIIGTLRHEGSHALAAMAEGAHIEEFVFWPSFYYDRFYWGYVCWEGSTTWFTLAAPYFCDLITFFAAFLIILVAKPKPRWLWLNIGIIGILSPFINSVVNYLGGLSGPNDVGRLLSAIDPIAVHLFFIITLLLYLWGIYYGYFRKRYQG